MLRLHWDLTITERNSSTDISFVLHDGGMLVRISHCWMMLLEENTGCAGMLF